MSPSDYVPLQEHVSPDGLWCPHCRNLIKKTPADLDDEPRTFHCDWCGKPFIGYIETAVNYISGINDQPT